MKPQNGLALIDESKLVFPVAAITNILQAIPTLTNLVDAQRAYCLIAGSGLDSLSFIGDYLIRIYAACGGLLESNKVFAKVHEPTLYTWNAIISVHFKAGDSQTALDLFYLMRQEDVMPNRVTYLIMLKVCYRDGKFHLAKLIHDEINHSEYKSNIIIENALIDMYSKFGNMNEAHEVFDSMVMRDVVSWGAIISGYAQNGHGEYALKLFKEMQLQGIIPDRVIFLGVLKAISQLGYLEEGRLIHEKLVRSEHQLGSDLAIGNSLVDMYGKCGSPQDSHGMFHSLLKKDVISWTALIGAYVNNKCEHDAVEIFEEMQSKNVRPVKTTYLCVLKACGNIGSIQNILLLHDVIIRVENMLDQEMENTLVDVYAKCKSVHDAQKVFDGLYIRNEVSWNALILGYSGQGQDSVVIDLFKRMQEDEIKPSEVILSSVLRACGNLKAFELGKSIHRKITQSQFPSDQVIQNALIDMYAKCGNMNEAQKAFNEVHSKNVVSWGAIISGYAQNGNSSYALELFSKMLQKDITPNEVIFPSVLKACGDFRAGSVGMVVHTHIMELGCDSNILVGNTLVDMYGKCGALGEAFTVFNGLHCRDDISWATMVAGCVQHGYGSHALDVYARMQHYGDLNVSRVIYLHVLKACAIVGAMDHCRLIHSQIVESELELDYSIGNTLIDTYSRCGAFEEAHQVFNGMHAHNSVSWATIIASYAASGNFTLAWQCLKVMQCNGLKPEEHIFTSILAACSNFGLLQEGKSYFKAMQEEFDMLPSVEHCSCILDLLGRSGGLSEAKDLVASVPFSPDAVVWRSLLANSRTHNSLEVACDSFVEIMNDDSSTVVDMSNMFSIMEEHGKVQTFEVDKQINEFMIATDSKILRQHFKDVGGHMPQLEDIVESKLEEHKNCLADTFRRISSQHERRHYGSQDINCKSNRQALIKDQFQESLLQI